MILEWSQVIVPDPKWFSNDSGKFSLILEWLLLILKCSQMILEHSQQFLNNSWWLLVILQCFSSDSQQFSIIASDFWMILGDYWWFLSSLQWFSLIFKQFSVILSDLKQFHSWLWIHANIHKSSQFCIIWQSNSSSFQICMYVRIHDVCMICRHHYSMNNPTFLGNFTSYNDFIWYSLVYTQYLHHLEEVLSIQFEILEMSWKYEWLSFWCTIYSLDYM